MIGEGMRLTIKDCPDEQSKQYTFTVPYTVLEDASLPTNYIAAPGLALHVLRGVLNAWDRQMQSVRDRLRGSSHGRR